jgi:hypothetical protein
VLPAIVAASLFNIRYRFDAHLDLRPPLTGMQQLMQDAKTEIAKLEAELQRLLTPDQPKDEQAKKQKSDADGEDVASNPPDKNASNTAAGGTAEGRQQTELADNTLAEEPQGTQQEQASSGDPQAEFDSNSSPAQGRDGRRQQQSAGTQPSNSDSGSSMINKLKDSMANLLSMAKSQPGGSGKPQTGKAGDGRSEDSRKQGPQGSNPAEAEPGPESSQPGSAKSSGTRQSSNPGLDKQAASGAGNEEGAKEIIRAEQLDAMGKLNAIFGKRAQNIAGEFTAEAPQGPQQLKTAYQQRSASHTDVHAKAQRDEVPVALQEYVERYFDLVKKAGTPAKVPHAVTASTRRSRGTR